MKPLRYHKFPLFIDSLGAEWYIIDFRAPKAKDLVIPHFPLYYRSRKDYVEMKPKMDWDWSARQVRLVLRWNLPDYTRPRNPELFILKRVPRVPNNQLRPKKRDRYA